MQRACRTSFSNLVVSDLKFWLEMGVGGLLMQGESGRCDLGVHTEVVELGWVEPYLSMLPVEWLEIRKHVAYGHVRND